MSKKFQDAPFDLSAEIRPLIHKLGMATGEEGRGAILTFIAARRGEGTTTVARSFVQALNTETGKRILLIEAGAEEDATGSGIVELAASGTNIAASLTEAGSGIFVGQWVASPQGRTQAGRIIQDKSFWQSLQNSFDVIVIDAPSLQSSSNGIAFAQASGSTILVVEAEATRKEVIQNLRDTLLAVNVKIAGIVMNNRKLYIPEKVYKRL
ncbi:MAG: hypothetical protein WCD70_16700 [Alphaproteobacteria bacterium]